VHGRLHIALVLDVDAWLTAALEVHARALCPAVRVGWALKALVTTPRPMAATSKERSDSGSARSAALAGATT
jgi:hypothetical protein